MITEWMKEIGLKTDFSWSSKTVDLCFGNFVAVKEIKLLR